MKGIQRSREFSRSMRQWSKNGDLSLQCLAFFILILRRLIKICKVSIVKEFKNLNKRESNSRWDILERMCKGMKLKRRKDCRLWKKKKKIMKSSHMGMRINFMEMMTSLSIERIFYWMPYNLSNFVF
jgi:hypothetical protein